MKAFRLPFALGVLGISVGGVCGAASAVPGETHVFPAQRWERRPPEEVGLSRVKLEALARLVGGRGCVARHGFMVWSWGDAARSSDVASAFKPLLSTLLLLAVQEGRLAGVDEPVAAFEPRLKSLNDGKDAAITWRHLASQTSGYGLAEAPGQAYSYNDYALALYYDTLMDRVFKQPGTEVLKTRLAGPLQFEDDCTFNAFGPNNRPGRLAMSVRDFARFGLLFLRDGQWRGRQVLQPESARLLLDSPIPADTPLTGGREAAMLPGQRSIGGTRNITPVGPGYYSFNWWLNRTNRAGQRLFADAPPDTIVASGHGGKRTLWIIPSLDLIVCWNDSPIEDHDRSPGNPDTQCNQAARLMREAVLEGAPQPAVAGATRLGLRDSRFTVNGQPTFLYGLSYYGALGASEEFLRRDLDDLQRFGFNWIRVWATWAAFSNDVAAVAPDGAPREPFLGRLKRLLAECDRRGLVVDVTLSRGNGVTGPPKLQTLEAHRRAVETLVTALKPWRNWYLDLSNERNIRDQRHTSFEELRALRSRARELDADLLVTASHAGDLSRPDLQRYLEEVRVDFLAPHRPRDAGSPAQTPARTRACLDWMKELGRVVPVHYQEPFRRGFGRWEPAVEDFLTDARAARDAGAAGWCLHNGDQRAQPEGRPRRSFDLSSQRLFDQLDRVEREAIQRLAPPAARP